MQPSLPILPAWLQITLALVPTVSAVFAAAGLLLNVLQSRRSNKQARATLVAKFLSDFADDEDMQKIFYDIEYSKFRYDDDFHESESERRLDKLLVHFSNLALAWKSGLLKDDDINPVQYYARRLLRDADVGDVFTVRRSMGCRCKTRRASLSSTQVNGQSSRCMTPNPSLKRSDNGMSRWPSSAGASPHFALAVQRAMPLSPA